MSIQMFSFIPFCLILFGIDILSVSSQCLSNQQSILIQLKNTIKFNSSLSTKIVTWNQSTDCCGWKGVSCSTDGHVIGLDLTNESITDGIENSSALFSLEYLCRLNLAQNRFNSELKFDSEQKEIVFTQIPPAIASLTNLVYLNLSHCNFIGQIPLELSNMIRLVTLDLSYNGGLYQPENSSADMYLPNLKELTELYLDGVGIFNERYDWCQAISSSMPKLKVLSLSDCSLSGPIPASLAKLQSLSVIRLSGNNLSGPVPEFLANFTNLTVLQLNDCDLNGQFPEKILQVPTLETLDLSRNYLLNGFLPIFPQNASLQTLVLSATNFSHTLPDSIGNLRMLSRLDLYYNYFGGQIPPSIASLTQLVHLDLSYNSFSGPIPSFWKSKNLIHLDLSFNGLSGQISNTYFKGLVNLEYIDLGSNAFNGSIPSSLSGLSSLQYICLSNNSFHGLLPNFSNPLPSLLKNLDLSSNRLEGPIPKSFFHLTSLDFLFLSNNLLNGTVELEAFSGLSLLNTLDLSFNNLSIETRGENSSLSLFPVLTKLYLVSCKLQHFPNLKNHSFLQYLDLSNNQIGGKIPSWIWKVGGGLISLKLSHNLLDNFHQPYEISPSLNLKVLDLHSNRLQGEIPIFPKNAEFLDFSANQFNSTLPIDIGHSLDTFFFSISNNGITGKIPHSLCFATNLYVLDLSNNHLSGSIPSCLIQLTNNLGVLNLGLNNLSGNIPGTFPSDCSLETLDLHGNHLEGKVPESLGYCSMLEVLNLGNNRINDTFPCFLKKFTDLRVLSLGSNKLHGDIQCNGATIVWSKLQIINLASNYFTGHVPRSFFLSLSAMIVDEDARQGQLDPLSFQFLEFYYLDEVTVVIKGNEIKLVKILTFFTSIDLSNNRFSGEISSSIGELKALYILNMSHNAFTGSVPASIGNLKQLGSLDLSVNHLTGMIPLELGKLTFLSVLNLSYNLLEGRIPAGPQLQTFTETSFEGNKGLCGSQLNISCVNDHWKGSSTPAQPPSEEAENNGFLISFEVGIVVGLATVIAPLVLSRRWNKWYFEQVDRIVAAKIYRYYQRRNQERKKPIRFA